MYFFPIPIFIQIETRQFPVTIHFNKRTNTDYCSEALRKTCKIHSQLPDGGILVFLTGQREVNNLVRKLRMLFPLNRKTPKKTRNRMTKEAQSDIITEDELNLDRVIQKARRHAKRKGMDKVLPNVNLDE